MILGDFRHGKAIQDKKGLGPTLTGNYPMKHEIIEHLLCLCLLAGASYWCDLRDKTSQVATERRNPDLASVIKKRPIYFTRRLKDSTSKM